MTAEDFSGYPLAIGQIYGVRQWNVDNLGRLQGVTFPQIWTPGENVASCKAEKQTEPCAKGKCGKTHNEGGSFSFIPGGPVIMSGPTARPCTEPDPCTGFDPNCKCGFWAYYSGDHTGQHYIDPWAAISGVISGYGKTTIGTKGFRCEKATIVAIRLHKNINPKHAVRIQRNYPDAEFFTSKKKMMAAYPFEQPIEPTPDNVDDFWTRDAHAPMDPPAHLWAKENS